MSADVPARFPDLRGKVAVVTGAAKGIGEGICVRLAAEGMHIAALDLDPEALEALAAELAPTGVTVLQLRVDMGVEDEIDAAFDEIEAVLGGVDVLVNNAADLRRVRLLDGHRDLLGDQMAVNVHGPYLAAERAAATMKERGGGSIINISSVGGLRAHHKPFPYDVTKGALNALTISLAVDLGEYGIRANAIGPGLTHTYRWEGRDDTDAYDRAARGLPIKRFGTPADIAATVAFLASDDAGYITGQVLYVDGGMTAQLIPAPTDDRPHIH